MYTPSQSFASPMAKAKAHHDHAKVHTHVHTHESAVHETTAHASPAKKKRGCRGCLRGCLWFFLVLLVIAGILAFFFFRVPERLGLAGNAAKKHLVYTPDRAGSQELLAEAQSRGLSTKGVNLYVFPYKEGDESVAVAVLDAREGFSFGQAEGLNPVARAFTQIAGGAKAEELGITRVTVLFLSENGNELMSLTAMRQDALAFANGSMSEADFMKALQGDVNISAMMNEQIQSFNKMMQ